MPQAKHEAGRGSESSRPVFFMRSRRSINERSLDLLSRWGPSFYQSIVDPSFGDLDVFLTGCCYGLAVLALRCLLPFGQDRMCPFEAFESFHVAAVVGMVSPLLVDDWLTAAR